MGADYRNVLGYLPQDFGYYPNYTAMEFLLYVSALKGIPREIARKRAGELLEEVGLSHVAGKKERVRFRNLLSDYVGDKIVILSTHIVSDVEAIADEVLLMKKGKFVLQGAVWELIRKADGKVWELTVPQEEAVKWRENYFPAEQEGV